MSRGHVFIVGFMGAGKSTVGARLAEELSRPFIDLDDAIEVRAGVSVAEVFAAQGEERFREMETEALAALDDQPASVVACGGGVVVSPENRSLLKKLGVVLYLQVSAGEAIARIGDVSSRPLLAGPGGTLAATSLLAAREALYSGVADACIDTSGASAEEVAMRALSVVEELL